MEKLVQVLHQDLFEFRLHLSQCSDMSTNAQHQNILTEIYTCHFELPFSFSHMQDKGILIQREVTSECCPETELRCLVAFLGLFSLAETAEPIVETLIVCCLSFTGFVLHVP